MNNQQTLVDEAVELTPGQRLHAVHAKHFRPNGWVDQYPTWDEYDAAGHAAWELMASDFLLSEREKTKGAVEALSAAVRWRQAQIERGILNMTDDELTEARAAQDKAMAALSTLTQEKTNVG